MQDWEKAAISFQKTLRTSPDNPPALLGLAKAQLARGNPGAALPILNNFPPGKELTSSEQLRDLAIEMSLLSTDPGSFPEDDLGAAYLRALKLVSMGNQEAAADGLLDILRSDKKYLDGRVHRVLVGLLTLMEDHPDVRKYRTELASVLF
jgi:thioredoxin-like negative regulator of GroEL